MDVTQKETWQTLEIDIPIPLELRQSSKPFLSEPEDIFAYAEGEPKCTDKNAKDIAFTAIVIDRLIKADSQASTTNMLSDFKCRYDKQAQTFVRCRRSYYSSYAHNIEFTASLAMLPSCSAAKTFMERMKQGNKIELIVTLCIVIPVCLIILFIFGIYYWVRYQDEVFAQHIKDKYNAKNTENEAVKSLIVDTNVFLGIHSQYKT